MQHNSSNASVTAFRLDKRDLERKVKLVEDLRKPFIDQMVTPDPNFSAQMPKSRTRNAQTLVQNLSDAISQLLNTSHQLCLDYPELKADLSLEINKIKDISQKVIDSSYEFANDSSSSQKRVYMGNNARILLSSVARLLAIAEMIDSFSIMSIVEKMQKILETMKLTKTEKEFLAIFKTYDENVKSVLNMIAPKFIQNMTDSDLKSELTSSLCQLTKSTLIIYTSSKTLIKHQTSSHASSLHEQVYKENFEVLKKIHHILANDFNMDKSSAYKSATASMDLLGKINQLENEVDGLNPNEYNNIRQRPNMESQMDEILRNIGVFTNNTDLIETDRNNRIIDECQALKHALLAIFDSYSDSRKTNSKMIENIQMEFIKISKSVKRQLRKAIIEKLATLNHNAIDNLINVAKLGPSQQEHFNEAITQFKVYANKLNDLSNMSCALSGNQDGIKMVQIACEHLASLVPYVIGGAQILYTSGSSKEACENMQVIRSKWVNQIDLLHLAIDDITCINDFLAVYEYQLHRDLNKCIASLNSPSAGLSANAASVTHKCRRICDMIDDEMNNYETCNFTNRVYESVSALKDRLLVSFTHSIENALASNPNENDLIESARLIYDNVRDMRNALFLIPHADMDSDYAEFDEEYDEQLKQQHERSSMVACGDIDDLAEIDEQTPITQEQRDKINQELSSLRKEKTNFDREVLKWDDQSNEIVVLAKQMCVIMMDMIKFTRAAGPYKTTMDIISAAKRINEIGLKLEKLCRKLASECPESQSKKELISYLNALPLFCNQLSIGTRVQENIIDPNTAKHLMLITSATSLIISSKNLMNTVISVVKSSYVASTKYSSKTDNKKPIVQWKMKPPELKPLINKPKVNETADLIRKATKAANFSPIKALSDFQE